jgi:hypothetical protein
VLVRCASQAKHAGTLKVTGSPTEGIVSGNELQMIGRPVSPAG